MCAILIYYIIGGIHGLMDRAWVRISGLAGIVGGESE